MENTPITQARQCKRRVCPKCNQNLSHAEYVRHQNPLVCPGKTETIKRKYTDQSSTAVCIQPTISFDDEEPQGQECSVIDFSSKSDAKSMESDCDNVEIMTKEDVYPNIDGD